VIVESTLAFLASPDGERLLADLAHEDLRDANTLRLLTRLRREHSGERAGAALEMARLRRDAVPKFGADAARMFFTRDALEQASDPLIRRWRVQDPTLNPSPLRKLRREGLSDLSTKRSVQVELLDVCCGIGADSLAFAAAGHRVLGIDLDPLRIEMARLNAAALGQDARFEVADAQTYAQNTPYVFFDPARRTADGKRIYDVESYIPPLALVWRWNARAIMVKLSPGVDLEQLRPYFDQGWAIDFVSVEGDLKEALLYSNAASLSSRRAILLTPNEMHVLEAASPALAVEIAEPRAWLCEPDAAAIRAGLVQQVAHMCGGSLLDETIAYFTTDTQPDTSWARAWQIEAWMPFNAKRLREYLRARGVGRVTVKKRGTAVTPDVLIPQLKLKGDGKRVIVLTRLRGQQIAMVCGV
jgi:SAM-dependent methyltransferase